jgi:hypothetical protein
MLIRHSHFFRIPLPPDMASMVDDLKKLSLPEIPLKEITSRLTKQRQQKSKTEDDNKVSKYFLKHTHNYENK